MLNGSTRVKAFFKVVNGKDVVLFVAKQNEGKVLQGQVIGAYTPKLGNPVIMKIIKE